MNISWIPLRLNIFIPKGFTDSHARQELHSKGMLQKVTECSWPDRRQMKTKQILHSFIMVIG